jgi:hypothetical protein
MKFSLRWDQVRGDDSRLLTDEAYDAIASTSPKGAARWPMQGHRDECFIQVEAAVVDRMRAIRRRDESYNEVTLSLVGLG